MVNCTHCETLVNEEDIWKCDCGQSGCKHCDLRETCECGTVYCDGCTSVDVCIRCGIYICEACRKTSGTYGDYFCDCCAGEMDMPRFAERSCDE